HQAEEAADGQHRRAQCEAFRCRPEGNCRRDSGRSGEGHALSGSADGEPVHLTTMAAVNRVLIVGAGMAGMTLGVALKRAGIACEIAEIRPALTEPGTGISLQGPALRALQAIGSMERCVERGFGYSHFKTCDAAGNVTGTVDLPRLLGPDHPATVGILRQAVHEVLAHELKSLGVPVRLDTTVAEF